MTDLHPEGARHAVIWLHGLGDSGAGLAPLVEALALPADLPVRHLLPDAPERPITINMGYRMRGWYDIKSFEDPADRAVESHVRESAARIASLIEQLVAEGFHLETWLSVSLMIDLKALTDPTLFPVNRHTKSNSPSSSSK
jgi:phospholipase/carboxylesterase